jgi:hydroxyethylthiazole kinase-like uncharacterized protein yjeF
MGTADTKRWFVFLEGRRMALNLIDIEAANFVSLLPFPKADANKYTRGRFVCVGGSREFPGAIAMAAKAGFLTGAGYVEVWGSAAAVGVVHSRYPSIVAREWGDIDKFGDLFCCAAGLQDVKDGHPCAVLLGSGTYGTEILEQRLFLDIIKNAECPIILDGGALRFVASLDGVAAMKQRASLYFKAVMTPHMGEAARLAAAAGLQVPPKCCDDDALLAEFAHDLSKAYGACVCLKGPTTYICDYRKDLDTVYVMRDGSAVLAKAGTGDVLAGIIGGLCAQGFAEGEAACLGTTLHAISGMEAAKEVGEISACAEDVLRCIPAAIQAISKCV